METIEIDGFVIFKKEKENYKNALLSLKEPYELSMFLNHIHILDETNNSAELDKEPWYDFQHPDFNHAWEIAKDLVNSYQESLKSKYPNYQFELLATKYDNPIFRFSRVHNAKKLNTLSKTEYRVIT